MVVGIPARGLAVEDFNTWVHYSITGSLRTGDERLTRWRYMLDSPNRFGGNSRNYSQGVWRGGIGYALDPKWSLWCGYGYSETDVPYTRTPFGENRIFQQLLGTGQVGNFAVAMRHRLEERFPETGDDMGARSRHQFRVSHPLGIGRSVVWVVWDEVFFNLNATDYGARTGLDQNRAFAGIGWKWSQHLRSEAGYLHHFNRRPGGENRVNHVFALSIALALK